MFLKHLIVRYGNPSLSNSEKIMEAMNRVWDESSWEVKDDGTVYRIKLASDGHPIVYTMVPENTFFNWVKEKTKENNNPIPTVPMIYDYIARDYITVETDEESYVLIDTDSVEEVDYYKALEEENKSTDVLIEATNGSDERYVLVKQYFS